MFWRKAKYNFKKYTIPLFVGVIFYLLQSCVTSQLKNDQAFADYPHTLNAIHDKQKVFFEIQKNDSLSLDSLTKVARIFLLDQFEHSIVPAWIGTKWDFNGTTEIPQQGTIACGYFVTTTLQAMSFQLNRYKLAQMASEQMILKLNPTVKRYSGNDTQKALNYIQSFDHALFLVGLDSHTGYILKTKHKLRFIHAVKYGEIDGVVSQEIDGRDLFSSSSYHVISELFTDEVVAKWIKGQKFE